MTPLEVVLAALPTAEKELAYQREHAPGSDDEREQARLVARLRKEAAKLGNVSGIPPTFDTRPCTRDASGKLLALVGCVGTVESTPDDAPACLCPVGSDCWQYRFCAQNVDPTGVADCAEAWPNGAAEDRACR